MVKSTALVTRIKDGKARLELEDVDLPNPQADQVLVKVHSIAQNPTDGKTHPLSRINEISNTVRQCNVLISMPSEKVQSLDVILLEQLRR